MEKRFLVAVVLCLLILMFYQAYMGKQQKRWKAEQEMSQQGREEPFSSSPAKTGIPEPTQGSYVQPAVPAQISAGAQGVPPPATRDLPCEEVVVETPLYQAILCSHNGRLISWKLKRYEDYKSCGCFFLSWFGKDTGCGSSESGPPNWVEIIRARGPEEYPLGIDISTGGSRVPLQEMLEPDLYSLVLQEGGGPSRIVFSGQDASGRKIRRTYAFSPDLYRVDLHIEIEGIGGTSVQGGLGLNLMERIDSGKADRYTFVGFMGLVNEKLVKKQKKDADQDQSFNGRVAWEGFSNKYFLNCLIPIDNPVSSVILDRYGPEQADDADGLWVSRLIYNIQAHTQENVGRFAYSLFIGPKAIDVLKASGHSLQDSIDLGWFGFIAEPLLAVLKFFFKYTHNYGVAIILLTILIKILFHPLTRKQYESMREMQKLQPKMKELREKYKNDRQKMNEEVMALYRTHKINPLGGCWPMLLQIPVFFALYKALLNSIELRQAPFMFWIQDLAAKDPCYISPIIMGGTMFLQQKMTPAAGDPAQQKMMMFMPIIFTFLFLNFPSGLVLYWLVNNVISIGQQYVAQKRKR